MVRKSLLSAVMLSASLSSGAWAQELTPPALPQLPSARPITAAQPVAAVSPAPVNPVSNHVATATPVGEVAQGAVMYGQPGQYPQLNAPLYPSPTQSGQPWSGGAIITNQAFAPHEMLYPHKYHAMYGPFYYRVKGHWVMTPFGMRQHEQWELQGTEVKVNYRSSYAPFSGFHPRF